MIRKAKFDKNIKGHVVHMTYVFIFGILVFRKSEVDSFLSA
jgi:hypothetical protein